MITGGQGGKKNWKKQKKQQQLSQFGAQRKQLKEKILQKKTLDASTIKEQFDQYFLPKPQANTAQK